MKKVEKKKIKDPKGYDLSLDEEVKATEKDAKKTAADSKKKEAEMKRSEAAAEKAALKEQQAEAAEQKVRTNRKCLAKVSGQWVLIS